MSDSTEGSRPADRFESVPESGRLPGTVASRDAQAVCVLAHSGSVDATLRAVLRARIEDYSVLVAVEDSDVRNAVEPYVAATVGRLDDDAGTRPLEARVVAEARERGFERVILVEPRPNEVVDYEGSRRELASNPGQDAVQARTTTVDAVEPAVVAVIPAYNEADTIAGVVAETARYVDEVVVVDDGSGDDTVNVARDAGAAVVEHETNQGYGAAVKTGFREADRLNADSMVLLDGDGQHDPESIPDLLAVQREEDAHIVIGSRYVDGPPDTAPAYRRVGLGVVNAALNASIRVLDGDLRVADTQSGFRAFDARAIRALAADDSIHDGMGASLDVLYRADRWDFTVREVSTDVRYDGDDSTHHPLAHGIDLLARISRAVEGRRPFLTLGVPGSLMATVGSLAFATGTFGLGLDAVSLAATVTGTLLVIAGGFALAALAVLHALDVFFARRETP